MQDKMFHMLAVCIILYPCRIDESLEQSMKEKVTFDKLNRLQGSFSKNFHKKKFWFFLLLGHHIFKMVILRLLRKFLISRARNMSLRLSRQLYLLMWTLILSQLIDSGKFLKTSSKFRQKFLELDGTILIKNFNLNAVGICFT